MNRLHHERCFNHALREAVARCPSCHRFFCRECVTEHEDRVVCAACLQSLARGGAARRGSFRSIVRALQLGLGLLLAWAFFLLLGQLLLSIPEDYHEGVFWRGAWMEEP